MKKYLLIVLLICIVNNAKSQIYVNNRFDFGYDFCGFGSVISTDSCYYVAGVTKNNVLSYDDKDAFIKFNLDGSLNSIGYYEEDTVKFDIWQSNNLILSKDNNFAQLKVATMPSVGAFYFIKQSPNGDTLIRTLLDTVNVLEQANGGISALWAGKLLQLDDSSYICSGTVGSLSMTSVSLPIVIKLDKNGNYLWHKTYYVLQGLSLCRDFIQFDDTTFLICDNLNGYNSIYPYWVFIDVDGNIKKTVLFNDSNNFPYTLNFRLHKNNDNSIITIGKVGYYRTSENRYVSHICITKLNEDLTKNWEIYIDSSLSTKLEMFYSLNEIIPVSNTEYIAIGNSTVTDSDTNNNTCGMLVKFNINGELLWQRKYVKILFEEDIWPTHELYDVDITPDSGFVMVGQAVNYNQNTTEPYGHLGWVVKTDKYGCFVPGCHRFDKQQDSTEVIEPAELYPNPTSNNLYYYHLQGDNTTPFTCYIFNAQGQVVQQFTVSADKVTYIIDVSQLASGMYIFKVVSSAGEVVKTSKFLKVN